MTRQEIGSKPLKTKSAAHAAIRLTVFPSRSMAGIWPGQSIDMSGMTQWEASNARSGYRVRLADGEWNDVPNFALIDPKTNKLGYAGVATPPREPSDLLLPPPERGLRKVPQALMAPNTALQRFLAPT